MLNNPYSDNAPYGHNNEKLIELDEVEEYTLEDFGLTVESMKNNHFGVSINDPNTGEPLPDAFYESKLETAVARIEKELDIVILPRVITEHHDFNVNDFRSHMYIHSYKKPIIQVENVRLEYGGSTVFNYPTRWWRVYGLHGHIQMMPTMMTGGGQDSLNLAQAYSGYPMIAGIPHLTQSQSAPQMFHLSYVAGLLPPKRSGVNHPHEAPADLWELIIKTALIEVFQQWGRLIIGPGIAGMDMNIDGISQRIDTTQSAMYGGASAEILQLNEDIGKLTKGLKSYFGMNLGII